MIYVRNDDMTDTSARPSLQAHYDTMWEHAFGAIARGDVDCDTRLAAGPDPRRGINDNVRLRLIEGIEGGGTVSQI